MKLLISKAKTTPLVFIITLCIIVLLLYACGSGGSGGQGSSGTGSITFTLAIRDDAEASSGQFTAARLTGAHAPIASAKHLSVQVPDASIVLRLSRMLQTILPAKFSQDVWFLESKMAYEDSVSKIGALTAGKVGLLTQAPDEVNICEKNNIGEIEAYVFDEKCTEIAEGGPWTCGLHEGTIKNVPAGDYRKVVIFATDKDSGEYTYRGEKGGHDDPITVLPGKTTRVGKITLDLMNIPNAPLEFEASEGQFPYKIQLSWQDVKYEDGYYIYRLEDDEWKPIGDTCMDTTVYWDDQPCGSGEIWYKVTAYNDFGESEDSESDNGFTADCPPVEPICNIEGQWPSGTGSETWSGCNDPDDNNTYEINGILRIEKQIPDPGNEKAVFRGSATIRSESFPGARTEIEELSGTLQSDGQIINGQYSYTDYDSDGIAVSGGDGDFAGSVSNSCNLIEINFSGRDTWGDTCDTEGSFTVNRSIPFNIIIRDLPATDNDGNYTLQWSATGLAAIPWTIQEDSNTSFSSPTTYPSYDDSPPYTYDFTDKTDGTYCYRVGLSPDGPFSEARCVTVSIFPPTTITITGLPATDNDGNYTLQWSATGLAATPWTIQEDSNTSFSSKTTYPSYDNSPPYTYDFTDKTDGTYCYRVGLGPDGPFSKARCVTVSISEEVATLRIVNNTRYDMIDIQLNGYQQFVYPDVIPVGQSRDFEFSSPGTVSYFLAIGFYDTNETRIPWFNLSGDTIVYAGQTTTITFNNPTIGQLLSGFNQNGRNWKGQYWCYSCNPILNYAKFHFGYGGSWTFYDNDNFIDNGTVALTEWPNYSLYVKFRLSPDEGEIIIYYPFGAFYYRNGPTDWPIIEYVAQ